MLGHRLLTMRWDGTRNVSHTMLTAIRAPGACANSANATAAIQ
jgi:hypothetical protein